jgi:hypothetical protein
MTIVAILFAVGAYLELYVALASVVRGAHCSLGLS